MSEWLETAPLKILGSQVTGRHLNVNGQLLHCIEAGPENGPLVVLLHGFPEFWWGWRHQIGPLAKAGFRVVVPDQRGYNLSSKPQRRKDYHLDILAKDIIDLCHALGREKFSLVGHDWGGIVAWWIASHHPEWVERLVIMNAPHPAVTGDYMRRHPSQILRSSYMAFFQIPRLPEAMLSAKNHRALKRSMRGSSCPGTFSDNDLEEYEKAWSQPDALTAMLNWYRALPLAKYKKAQGMLSMPVLLIWGMRDQFLEFGLCEASLKQCINGNLRQFDQATHWVHLEKPSQANEELIAFLKA
jgi:pimeloyl-ACP methyl ester carboxylesterase